MYLPKNIQNTEGDHWKAALGPGIIQQNVVSVLGLLGYSKLQKLPVSNIFWVESAP